MANKAIAMSKLRSVLRLYVQNRSKLFISEYLNISRNTVKKYLRQFTSMNMTFEELDKLSDAKLEELFLLPIRRELSPKHAALFEFFPYVEKELKKVGVTKLMLWQEYIARHPDGLRSTQFCEHYNLWSKRVNPVMHMTHKAGDKMFVDYAGKTLQIVDKQSGEIKEVQFFVAILGASQLTYGEATASQQKEDFIGSVENALHFYQGVPAAIVTDNLKSAVSKSNRYEPTLNETFLDFSEYYGTTILPARAYRPRDKALVEGAVKILYSRVYGGLRDKTFFDLKSLNKAIRLLISVHNNTELSGRAYSRLGLFKEVEQQRLSALPVHRYQIKQQCFATVMQNGHVCLGQDKHYYSVPYVYIRKKVKILYSARDVEIYHKYNRIAVHPRLKSPYNYTTIKEHLASTHRFVTEWTPQRFIDWAASIDDNVKQVIIKIFEKKQHPEQAYKSCMGILSLRKKAGDQRLAKACRRALEYGIYNYKIVQSILEKGLDNTEEDKENDQLLPGHNNIRGKDYYH